MNILSVGFSLIKELGARFDEIGPLLDQRAVHTRPFFLMSFVTLSYILEHDRTSSMSREDVKCWSQIDQRAPY